MNDIELKKKIEDYIDEHEDELLKDVAMLCSIDSVKGAEAPGAPYGEGPKKALMAAKNLCESYGLKTKIYDNRVISADMNDGEKCLDILAHMDVVAPGDGWTVTNPFEPKIIDGAIYGRGTSDDKGPALAALYAMRAVRELGIDASKNCRLILGSDEECGSSDIPHYYAVEKAAPMTFSPDAEFPLINIEKGQFKARVFASIEDAGDTKRLIELKCGDTINIVPGKGYMIVKGFSEAEIKTAVDKVLSELFAEKDEKPEFTLSSTSEDEIRIDIKGKAAHASTPELGINSGVVLLYILSELSFSSKELKDKLSKLRSMFPYGDFTGKALGINLEDEYGSTSLTPNIFEGDFKHISVRFDSRTCTIADEDNTILKAAMEVEKAGFSFEYSYREPHIVSADSDFIKALLEQYTLVTGIEGRCNCIGGGTYVHEIENGVAFGAVGETTDTRMHGPDEFMLISELKTAAVIYALCIAKLCK